MQFVKGVYSELPSHLNKIFEPKPPIRVKDITDLNLEQVLSSTYTVTLVHCEQRPHTANSTNLYQTVSNK